ncbi:hypothetical protein R75461_07884 [Paraburkholderia nemoris]|uniref:DUF2968 domain-containing protein n=1 Tax=Paraburkholderia nemoris TaxID=2793076 RepID=UPI00190A404F|nr:MULTISPECIES: DUF2968 domain-containing protein [Paraburkholderia]MBK3786916.1 DUF2968 domain-containing protein [Paraburkholderia aspalathi]CAE6859028.1 hypothetical protein R75461_07884 [Paraburkholderia nemoris]
MKLFNRSAMASVDGLLRLMPGADAGAPIAERSFTEGPAGDDVLARASGQPGPSGPVLPAAALRAAVVRPAPPEERALRMADTADFEALKAQQALASFRTFQSFGYSVNLLFHASEVTWYIALYHDGTLWRVLKTPELDAARSTFRHLQDEAMCLADEEMLRAQLEAQQAHLADLAGQAQVQAQRLRADMEHTAALERELMTRQQQIRKEIAQLGAGRGVARMQLDRIHRQVRQLDAAHNEGVPRQRGG